MIHDPFLQTLQRSHLLPESELSTVAQLAPQFADTRQLVYYLMQQGLLTLWQAGQLMAGRYTLFLGPYKLRDKIGTGGMGAVYQAEDTMTGLLVALKVMNPKYLKDQVAFRRFLREARAGVVLNHPNIVTVHGATSAGQTHFIVMEYVEGSDLGAWLKQYSWLPIDWACECARQAALGLQHALEKGLVHRDIKPSNLLVVTDQPDGLPLVKLLDMGLARFVSSAEEVSELTQSGQIMGTVDYLSPEQARSTRKADIRSDIFSLGCTLFKLLTGEVPFAGENVTEKLMARATEDAPPVSRLRPEVPSELDAVVAKMLDRDPKRRYQTPIEAARALQAFAMNSKGPSSMSRKLTLKKGSINFDMFQAECDPELNEVQNQLADHASPAPLSEQATQVGISQPTTSPGWQYSEPHISPAVATSFSVEQDTRLQPPPSQTVSTWNSEQTGQVPTVGRRLWWTDRLAKYRRWIMFFGVPGGIILTGGLIFALLNSSMNGNNSGKIRPLPYIPSSSVNASSDFPLITLENAREHQQMWARRLGMEIEQRNSVGVRMVLIPPGEFWMGSDEQRVQQLHAEAQNSGVPDWYVGVIAYETPQHRVRISQPFYLSVCELTQLQADAVMGAGTWSYSSVGPQHPVDACKWQDAVRFCNILSQRERLPLYYQIEEDNVRILGGHGYRLPTEAEWEYACRAGSPARWSSGDNAATAEEYGWFSTNAETAQATCGKRPNLWGLYDMQGNVWEWCWDVFAEETYRTPGLQTDPTGPNTAGLRLLRGGGWRQSATVGRCATRLPYSPYEAVFNDGGFRLVRNLPP